MDRIILQPGAIPLVEDGLETQRFTMLALGRAMRAIYGDFVSVDGLECLSTTPASMSIIVNPGCLIFPAVIDAASFGTLAADMDPCTKVAIAKSSQVFAVAPPQTLGQAITYRVVACAVEVDDTPTVQPYFNAANPAQPYSGPGGGGAAVNRYRRQRVGLEILAGAPALVGTQQPPPVPPGYVPLYLITVLTGQVSIGSDSIRQDPASPVAQFRLPQLTPGFSRMQVFGEPGATTWTVPNGVRQARVRVLGAGGGGAAANPGAAGADQGYTDYKSGAGGGSGGFVEAVIGLTPGDVVPMTVGTGGVGGVAAEVGTPGGNGATGGTSSFSSYIASTGGQGGYWTSNPIFSAGGQGGQGYGPGIAVSGGYGADGQAGDDRLGDGAPGLYGAGGRAGVAYGLSGLSPGSGGGGCYDAPGPGGLGAAGLVIVEY